MPKSQFKLQWPLFAGTVYLTFLAFLAIDPVENAWFFSLSITILLVFLGVLEHETEKGATAAVWTGFLLLACFPVIFWSALSPWQKASCLAALAILAATLLIGETFFVDSHKKTIDIEKRLGELKNSLKSKARENEFYLMRRGQLGSQIGQRKRLSSYARQMGTLLDPELIRQALIQETQRQFPKEQVQIKNAGMTTDPIDHWVSDRRNSLLVKELSSDSRFPQRGLIQAVVATPLLIGKSMAGLIRVDSDAPNRFSGSDLQQLEVYAHLAGLALENAQLFQRVNAMATQDGLTGLATHRIFQEKLGAELLRGARYRSRVSLVMVDIDHFKSVNDTYGHLAGDAVLKEISRILIESCRPVDFAARYGGEEFCLILPELDLKQAREKADELRCRIEGQAIPIGAVSLTVTASLGCSTFPEDAQMASQLIRRADERLYKAKSGGRNKVVAEG